MKATRTPAQERWLRFYNKVVYESLPFAYNALDRLTFGVWWHFVQRSLEHIPPGGNVLEIGFGPGRLQVELAKRADLCLGLDLAWGMCRFTHQRLLREGLSSRLVRGTVFALPYPALTFDVVVSTFAFSGFPQGKQAMAEMARVVATGGRLVLVDIGLPADQNQLGSFFARLWQSMGDFLYDQPRLMFEAGLDVITCEEFGPGNHIRVIVGQKPDIASPQKS